MFRLATILSICIFAVVLMAGSVSAGKVWEAGLKAGMSYSNLSGTSTIFSESKTGLCVGGFITRNLGRHLAVQMEILYAIKGGKDASGTDATAEKLNISYLEIPLFAKVVFPGAGGKTGAPSYRSVGGEGLRPGFYLGPVVSFKLSADYAFSEEPTNVKNSDYGIAFGGGIDAALPKGKFLFDLRYTLGMSDILDDGANSDARNVGLVVMLGYIF